MSAPASAGEGDRREATVEGATQAQAQKNKPKPWDRRHPACIRRSEAKADTATHNPQTYAPASRPASAARTIIK